MNRTALPRHFTPPNVPAVAHRTDTARILRLVDDDPDTTVEFFPVWLLPPVTTVYRTSRRARLTRRWARVRRSPFAAHLRASADSAYWVGVVLAGIFLALVVAVSTRGQYLTPHGWQPIPTTTQHAAATGGVYR